MPAALEDKLVDTTLRWSPAGAQDREQLDHHRVTEDAAEAITLALVYSAYGWVVRRRMQRGESADWLMVDPGGRGIALEISGMDSGDHVRRLREKLAQVHTARFASRAACVVVLRTPEAALGREEGDVS
jgi:hypothetical protein